MRICLVSQEYPPETGHGGIASQTHLKAHGMAALGHEVHVLSHSPDRQRHASRDGPVRVNRIPGPDGRLPVHTDAARWLLYSAEVAAALEALQERHAFDLIDFPEWAAEGFVPLLNRTRGAGPRIVVQIHGPLVMLTHGLGWPERDTELYRVGSFMEGTCLRLADSVYASSALSARWCAEHYGLRAEQIPILHSGVDTRRFRPLEVDRDERPTVVFVGKVGPSKGADILVEAACRLVAEFPDLRVRLLGPEVGRAASELRARVAAAGHPELIELPGPLARSDAPHELCRAHVFASPSPWEGGPGFVCLEAMACGLPVVTCSGSGLEEVVENGQNGLLVPPGDAGALADAIGRLLRDGRERAALGRRARRWAEEHAGAGAAELPGRDAV
jgi:glycosyltransferase involved in cell wall biosynthesis